MFTHRPWEISRCSSIGKENYPVDRHSLCFVKDDVPYFVPVVHWKQWVSQS
ncbi:hypothetical protein IWX65_003459 [Arthrobacter sp. CAN_A214]